jgi:hypothetical protein
VTDELSPYSDPSAGSASNPGREHGIPSAHQMVVAASPAPVLRTPEYRDRGTGLVVFGVVQIILGLLAALMIPLAALGAFLTRFSPGMSMRPAQYLSGMATYALAAAVLITLGIGSIQTKRWARALTLVISWYWLITGVLITVLMTAVLPVAMRAALHAQPHAAAGSAAISAGVIAVVLTIIIVLAASFLILVPIALIVFYGRKDVAETCRHRDPIDRWTDRVPLPVLGASVVFVAQALYLLSTGLATPLFPFFGHYLSGGPAMVWLLAFAGLDTYLALAFLRVNPIAWWIAVVAAPIRLLSMAITFGRADLMQAYAKLGWSDAQMRVLSSSPLFRSHVVLWWSLISAVLFFGYVLWIRRYFRTSAPAPRESEVLPVQVG